MATLILQTVLKHWQLLGCDIIVDDIFYFAEPYFQNGDIAQAVNTVAQDEVLYFSSAGNSSADSWEGSGEMVDNGTGPGPWGRSFDFDPSPANEDFGCKSPFPWSKHSTLVPLGRR